MPKPAPVYNLGGAQTDFARNWTKEGKHFVGPLREAVLGALEATRIEPKEVGTAHVGNFAAELYAHQGHIGAFFLDVDPAFYGLPTSRHEAACASGSIAILAASAEIEAGRYDLACVVGVEQMKTVDSTTGGDFLGTAAWYEKEAKGIEFPFPKLFGRLGDEYDKRYGLKDEHLAHISAVNYSNAKRNPLAQTRNWFMSESHAQKESKFNQVIGGRIKVSDCSQVTDGSAAIFLASENYATEWAKRNGKHLADIPRILGWGHRTAPLEFDVKMSESYENQYVLPHPRHGQLHRRTPRVTACVPSGDTNLDCHSRSKKDGDPRWAAVLSPDDGPYLPTTKAQLVVPLPPMFSIAVTFAPST